jgi:predicted TPR repeat methyltransferase
LLIADHSCSLFLLLNLICLNLKVLIIFLIISSLYFLTLNLSLFIVYVGDLKPIFRAFSSMCRSGDHLIFTLEDKDEILEDENAPVVGLIEMKKRTGNWILQKSGRFAHTKRYVRELVESLPKLSVLSMKSIIPR